MFESKCCNCKNCGILNSCKFWEKYYLCYPLPSFCGGGVLVVAVSLICCDFFYPSALVRDLLPPYSPWSSCPGCDVRLGFMATVQRSSEAECCPTASVGALTHTLLLGLCASLHIEPPVFSLRIGRSHYF